MALKEKASKNESVSNQYSLCLDDFYSTIKQLLNEIQDPSKMQSKICSSILDILLTHLNDHKDDLSHRLEELDNSLLHRQKAVENRVERLDKTIDSLEKVTKPLSSMKDTIQALEKRTNNMIPKHQLFEDDKLNFVLRRLDALETNHQNQPRSPSAMTDNAPPVDAGRQLCQAHSNCRTHGPFLLFQSKKASAKKLAAPRRVRWFWKATLMPHEKSIMTKHKC